MYDMSAMMDKTLLTFIAVFLSLIATAKGYCYEYDSYDNCTSYYYVYSQWWFWIIWVVIVVTIVSVTVCCCYRRRYYAGQVVVSQPATTVTSVTMHAPPGSPVPPTYPGSEYDNPTGYWHPPPQYSVYQPARKT